MAKDSVGDSSYPHISWGNGVVGSFSHPAGSGETLDARKRQAPPVGADVKPKKRNKRPKARSSVNPW